MPKKDPKIQEGVDMERKRVANFLQKQAEEIVRMQNSLEIGTLVGDVVYLLNSKAEQILRGEHWDPQYKPDDE